MLSDPGVIPDGLPGTPAAHEARPPAGLRVLLAEDDPLVRRIATAVLERAGHQVIAVEDGRAAVSATCSACASSPWAASDVAC